MDNFDFVATQKIYADNKFFWADKVGSSYIPTVEDLMSTAQCLFNEILRVDKITTTCSTGRLAAYKFEWGYKLAFEPYSRCSF